MINGYAGGRGDWGPIVRMVGTRARRPVIVLDQCGVGGTAKEAGPFTIEQLAADAHAVVKDAGFERVAVCGLSLGGMVAQSFALEYLEATAALMMGGTTHGGRDAVQPPARFLELCAELAQHPEPNLSEVMVAFIDTAAPPALWEGDTGALRLSQAQVGIGRTMRAPAGMQGQLAAMMRFNSTSVTTSASVTTSVTASVTTSVTTSVGSTRRGGSARSRAPPSCSPATRTRRANTVAAAPPAVTTSVTTSVSTSVTTPLPHQLCLGPIGPACPAPARALLPHSSRAHSHLTPLPSPPQHHPPSSTTHPRAPPTHPHTRGLQVMPRVNSESLARRIDGAQLAVLEGAGHAWWARQPIDATRRVARFLDDCP